MSELYGQVSEMLGNRRRAAALKKAQARQAYYELMTAEKPPAGAAETLLAAIDTLELTAGEFSSDVRAIERARVIQAKLAAAFKAEAEAAANVEAASRAVEAIPHGYAAPRQRARSKVNELVEIQLDCHHRLQPLQSELRAVTSTAPRIFGLNAGSFAMPASAGQPSGPVDGSGELADVSEEAMSTQ